MLIGSALVATSLSVGYYFGAQSRSFIPRSSAEQRGETKTDEDVEVQEAESESEDDEEEEEEDITDGDLSAIKAGFMQPCKLVSAQM